jgi:hypothetical protein
MHKTTEITIETERFLVVSRRPERANLWCHRCANTVLMLTVDEAARTGCTTPLVISTLAEAGLLHFAVIPEGRLFICSNSLAFERDKEFS